MRDDKWLFQKLDEIWDRHFSDVPQNNDVLIKFGRRAKQRLGSIKQETKNRKDLLNKNRKTIITINGIFKDEEIPEYVVIATIAHEMCHYTHGFSSPLEQKFPNPHQGGIVTKEMKARGFDKELKLQKKWLKDVWPEYIKEKMPARQVRRRRRRVIVKWI
ncbi:hypothetical protein C4544_04215 [candidate division WS5 bacterium]|uniref:SprT-like domain-containing protein n=1 Tax=candidate division WS5 bacterium TaxID=2093353 RepID=A0A419DCV5_9BACT|nr:MAG: hypothetical protein C4544_04215 [candidate division WS5 bacterium]